MKISLTTSTKLTMFILLLSTARAANNTTNPNSTAPTNGTTPTTNTDPCLVDMCLVCPNATSLVCTKCRAGWYLRLVESGTTPYNVCWSIWKLLVWLLIALLLALLCCYCCLAAYRSGLGKGLIPCRWDDRYVNKKSYYETQEPPRVVREEPRYRESVRVVKETPRSSVRYVSSNPVRYVDDPNSRALRVPREPSYREPSYRYVDESKPVRRIVSVRDLY